MPITVTQTHDKARAVKIALLVKKSRDNKFNSEEKPVQKKLSEKRQNFQKESGNKKWCEHHKATSHNTNECRSPSLEERKCFKCEKVGHIARNCKGKAPENKKLSEPSTSS